MVTLVTGATGLVGNNVVRCLLAEGHAVRVLARQGADAPPLAGLDIEIARGDVRDRTAVNEAMRGAACVVHAAGDVRIGWTALETARAINVEGTRNVAEAARDACARLVHVSSIDALGTAGARQVADENTPGGGGVLCPYVVTKREAEQVVLDLVGQGLNASIVNPGFMIGPYDWKPSSGRMLLQVARGWGLFAPLGANSYCDVRDVAAGIHAALRKGEPGRRYILAGETLSYFQAWRIFAEVTGGTPPVFPAGPLARIAAGRVGDLVTRLTGREPDVNSAAAAMSAQSDSYRAPALKPSSAIARAPWARRPPRLGHGFAKTATCDTQRPRKLRGDRRFAWRREPALQSCPCRSTLPTAWHAADFCKPAPWRCLPAPSPGAIARAATAGGNSAGSFGRAKHCILVYLLGGPPQIDMWDMKPDAPAEIRGPFRPIASTVPGMQFCEHLPRLAGWAKELAILRSVTFPNNDHPAMIYHTLTGRESRVPLGANTVLPPSRSRRPAHGLGRRSLQASRCPRPRLRGDSRGAGADDGRCRSPAAGGPACSARHTIRWRSTTTRANRSGVQAARGALGGAVRRAASRCWPMLDGRCAARGDVAPTIERIATRPARLVGSTGGRRSVLAGRRAGLRCAIGMAATASARACWWPAGWSSGACSFVGVHFNYMTKCDGWDTHQKNFESLKGELLPLLDEGLSALIGDLRERGLLDETLVVTMGEFGRTPRVNKDGGRDHWGPAASVVFAGGGIRGGTIVGATDRTCAFPTEHPVAPARRRGHDLPRLGTRGPDDHA